MAVYESVTYVVTYVVTSHRQGIHCVVGEWMLRQGMRLVEQHDAAGHVTGMECGSAIWSGGRPSQL